MSYVDLQNATPEDLITHFVLECRGSGGHFLAYSDHQIVTDWLKAANDDADELLVVLSEALPDYFVGGRKSLAGVNKLVHLRIQDRRARLGSG